MFATARRVVLALVLATSLAWPASALEPEQARVFVEDIADRATDILGDRGSTSRAGDLRNVLEAAFDLGYIGRLVLGPTYRSLSDEQRLAYDRAFERYVLGTYSSRIDDYGGERLEIFGAERAGSQDVKVQSRVVGAASTQPVRIDWRVRERASGPRIIDVEIEGVSMAISQRSEFASVVEQRGVDGLIALLEERSPAS